MKKKLLIFLQDKPLYILIGGLLLSLTIRGFFILSGTDSADVTKLREMGEAVLSGVNPYRSITYNIYPPIALYLEALTLFLANLLHVPFYILSKLWPNLADVATTVLLYKYLVKLKTKPIFACFWSLFYVLNPLTIITSAAHGQIDSIPSFFVLLAIYLFTSFKHRAQIYLAGLFLGLAIAIKPNPALLIPLFLIYPLSKINTNSKALFQKFIFLGLSTGVVGLSFIPYISDGNFEAINNALKYSGVYDMGLAAILRGILYQENASIWLPGAENLLTESKFLFLVGWVFLLVIFARSLNLLKAALLVYLMFLGIYIGISVQYLSWILPLAIISKDRFVIIFSLLGTLAMLGFYMFFGPEILLGRFYQENIFRSKYLPLYFFGNAALWFTIIWWAVGLIRQHLNQNFSKFSSLQRYLTYILMLIFLILSVLFLHHIFILLLGA